MRSGSFSAALSSENQFYVWGRGVFGDFYTPHRVKILNKLDITDFKVSNGGSAYILTEQGQVFAWGNNNYGQLGNSDFQMKEKPQKIKALENKHISRIAIGNHFVIALGQNVQNPGAQCHTTAQTNRTETGEAASSSVVLRENSNLISIDQVSNARFNQKS